MKFIAIAALVAINGLAQTRVDLAAVKPPASVNVEIVASVTGSSGTPQFVAVQILAPLVLIAPGTVGGPYTLTVPMQPGPAGPQGAQGQTGPTGATGATGPAGAPGTGSTLAWQDDLFASATAQDQSFTLAFAPSAAGYPLAVYKNGLLMRPGVDFTATATALQFTPTGAGQGISPGDLVEARYQH